MVINMGGIIRNLEQFFQNFKRAANQNFKHLAYYARWKVNEWAQTFRTGVIKY